MLHIPSTLSETSDTLYIKWVLTVFNTLEPHCLSYYSSVLLQKYWIKQVVIISLPLKNQQFYHDFWAKNLDSLFSHPLLPIHCTGIKKKSRKIFSCTSHDVTVLLKISIDFTWLGLVEVGSLPSLSVPPPPPCLSHPGLLAAFLGHFSAEFSHLLVPQPVPVPSVPLGPMKPHFSGIYKGHIFRKAFPDHPSWRTPFPSCFLSDHPTDALQGVTPGAMAMCVHFLSVSPAAPFCLWVPASPSCALTPTDPAFRTDPPWEVCYPETGCSRKLSERLHCLISLGCSLIKEWMVIPIYPSFFWEFKLKNKRTRNYHVPNTTPKLFFFFCFTPTPAAGDASWGNKR